jgi:hypothetical protein
MSQTIDMKTVPCFCLCLLPKRQHDFQSEHAVLGVEIRLSAVSFAIETILRVP